MRSATLSAVGKLLYELEVVIVESLVVFKVVLLALKEPVDLCEP